MQKNSYESNSKGQRVRCIRSDMLKMSRPEFCRHATFTDQALKGWELNWGGGLTERAAKKFISASKKLGIECSVEWLMLGTGDAPYFVGIPPQISEELSVFLRQPNSVTASVSDKFMIPFLHVGDIVGGLFVDAIEEALGKQCILLDEFGNKYVRVLQKGTLSGRFNLTCPPENQEYAETIILNMKIKQAAPICLIRKNPR